MTPSEKRNYRLGIGAALAAAIVLRLVYLWQISGNPFFSYFISDSAHFDQWASQIASGDLIGTEPYFRAPLYPYLLGFLYWILERDFLWIRLVQHGIGVAGVWATATLARRFWDRRAGLVAAWLAALYPTTIFFEGELLLDFLLVTLAPLMLLGIQSAARSGRTRSLIGAGLLVGLFAITRPTILATVPILAWWVYTGARIHGSRARAFGRLGLLAAGMLLIIAPITARNLIVGDDWVLISSQGGVNFYIGNNSHADGMSAALPPWGSTWRVADAAAAAEAAHGTALKPSAVSAFWTQKALDFWMDRPLAAVRLTVRKWLLFWHDREFTNNQDMNWFLGRWGGSLLFIPLTFGSVAALGGLGWCCGRRRRSDRTWLLLWVLTYALSVTAFFVVARFRLPVVPVLIAAGGAGIAWLWERAGVREYKRLFGALAGVVFVMILLRIDWLHAGTASLPRSYLILGNARLAAGEPANARVAFDSALAIDPNFKGLWLSRGTAFYVAGLTDSAAHSYRMELRRRPDDPATLTSLAQVEADRGDTGAALAYLDRALSARPYDHQAAKLKARLWRAGNRPDLALRTLTDAGAMRRATPDILLLTGTLLLDLGQLDAADSLLQQCIAAAAARPGIEAGPDLERTIGQRDPSADLALAHYNRGVIAGYRGRWPDAIRSLIEATGHDPGLGAGWSNLATAYLRTGDPNAALAAARQAVAVQPGNPVFLVTLAMAHLANADTTAALESLQSALAADSGFAPALGIMDALGNAPP